jgi:hypothetical protein
MSTRSLEDENAEARYSQGRVVVKKKSSQARAASVEKVLKSCERPLLNPSTISTPGLSTEIFISLRSARVIGPVIGDMRQMLYRMTDANDPKV